MSHPVRRILGAVARERGETSEQRLLAACQLATRPSWMRSARRATLAEDHAGIDVVVESDVGKLFIQVKSSKGGKAAFLERRRSAAIGVVVVKVTDTPEQLLAKATSALAPLRRGYLDVRRT